MGIPNSKTIQESDPSVLLTVGQLRLLIREEVEKAMGTNGKAASSPENAPKPYLSVKEAADLSPLAPSTIRAYIRKGKLKAEKVGRRVIIKRTDLERFVEAHPLGTDEN